MTEGTDVSDTHDFDQQLAQASRALMRQRGLAATAQEVVDSAAAILGPGVSASLTLLRRGEQFETPATSDSRALRADQMQYDLGVGPCMDASRGESVRIDDLSRDERYPQWTRSVVAEIGIRSSLSVRLYVDEDGMGLGALNLYASHPQAFDAEVCGEAEAFAAVAAAAVSSERERQHLRTAMATRNIIGQAQGVLMERMKLTSAQAFELLVRLSQDSNVKLREVARRVTETGEVGAQRVPSARGEPAHSDGACT